jgi:hypothetical protein
MAFYFQAAGRSQELKAAAEEPVLAQPVDDIKETLNKSEVTWHMNVSPYSIYNSGIFMLCSPAYRALDLKSLSCIYIAFRNLYLRNH